MLLNYIRGANEHSHRWERNTRPIYYGVVVFLISLIDNYLVGPAIYNNLDGQIFTELLAIFSLPAAGVAEVIRRARRRPKRKSIPVAAKAVSHNVRFDKQLPPPRRPSPPPRPPPPPQRLSPPPV